LDTPSYMPLFRFLKLLNYGTKFKLSHRQKLHLWIQNQTKALLITLLPSLPQLTSPNLKPSHFKPVNLLSSERIFGEC